MGALQLAKARPSGQQGIKTKLAQDALSAFGQYDDEYGLNGQKVITVLIMVLIKGAERILCHLVLIPC